MKVNIQTMINERWSFKYGERIPRFNLLGIFPTMQEDSTHLYEREANRIISYLLRHNYIINSSRGIYKIIKEV